MAVKYLTFTDCFNLGVADARAGIPMKHKSKYSMKQLTYYTSGYRSINPNGTPQVITPKPANQLKQFLLRETRVTYED